MTRIPHDQFAKNYLKELLTPLGDAQSPRQVAGEVREIDVWFAPKPQPTTDPQMLGLLGRFASSPCILEPFRNAPKPSQIRSCMSKLFDVHSELERQAKREKTSVQEGDLPRLWILSPTASVTLLDKFKATIDKDSWPDGVYFIAEGLKTAIVAIHQLPRTQETLLLRILGRGGVQKQAINELAALPANHPLRSNKLLLLLTNLQANLQSSKNLTEEDKKLIMELSPLVLQWQEEAERKGRRTDRRDTIENLLKTRFGELDDALAAIIEPMLELPPEEYARLILELSHVSREELLNRFDKT